MTTMNLFRRATNYVSFSAGQRIFGAGEPGDVIYVVQEGLVYVTAGGRVLDAIGPGGIVGEMALVDKKGRSASVVARTDCKLVPVGEQQFHHLVQQTPYFALQVMQIMADRLRRSLESTA